MINFFKINELTRIKKNIQGNLVLTSSLVLIQFFHLPLMIYIWGIEKTGYWFYLLAIPSLLSFWKLNVSEASKQELIIKINANKNEIYTISFLFTFITLLIFAVIYFTINIKYINFFEIFVIVKHTPLQQTDSPIFFLEKFIFVFTPITILSFFLIILLILPVL